MWVVFIYLFSNMKFHRCSMAKHTHFTSFIFLIYLWGGKYWEPPWAYLSNTETLRQSSCCTTCCQNLVALLLRMGLSRWVSGGVQEQSVRRFWPLWQEGKGLLLPCQLVSLSYLAVSEHLLVIRAAGSHSVFVMTALTPWIFSVGQWYLKGDDENSCKWCLKPGRARSSTQLQASSACSNSANENSGLFLG